MKIYIAGKVTGLNYNQTKVKFDHIERWLISLGHTPVNPIKLVPENEDWDKAMHICLQELYKCEAIYLISDWIDSRGAKTEVSHAISLGLEILDEHKMKLKKAC